jgi:uncharacterized protein YjbI with pentapeptide repeats
LAATTQAFAQEACDGPFKGKKPTPEQLAEVLANHRAWIEAKGPAGDERRARLCEADLSRVVLSGAVLIFADLSGADLSKAVLRRASLRSANLFGANLSGANLSWADLRETSLRGAHLFGAEMNQANLGGANLKGADLRRAFLPNADLRLADLFGANLIKANLIQSDLRGAKLQEADLRTANLSGADLSGADLMSANLSEAILSNATLGNAFLEGAELNEANLSGADLFGANLFGANLRKADLSEAILSQAELAATNLSGANLENAVLFGANVAIAHFYPEPLSDITGLRNLPGLSEIKIDDVGPIVDLRKKFKEAGFKSEEKALTSALRKHELSRASMVEKLFAGYVMGGAITDFGADPSLAVITLFMLIPVFACFYLVALLKPGKDGIWQRWIPERSRSDLGSDQPVLLKKRGIRAVAYGLYFSLLSAFHIGWKDFNVGSWIARVQPREYTLSGSGWVRTVSGIQSLISVYLLAMAALSYFGRPFE